MTAPGPFRDDEGIALLRRIALGDAVAMQALFQRLAPRLRLLARRVLGRSPEADDVVQETFIQVWEHAGDFDFERGSVVTWVSVIARSRAFDRMRAGRRRVEAELEVPALSPASPFAPEDHGRLMLGLDQLAIRHAQVLRLAYLDGLTQSEIASQLGMPLGTVKTRTRKGLARLAVMLQVPGS